MPAVFCEMTRTNPRGTRSPSAWALPRIVIRMSAGLVESCTAKATGAAGVKNSACSISAASLPTRASQLPPLLSRAPPAPSRRSAGPPALLLALEYRADLSDAMPCPLTLGRERRHGLPMLRKPGFPLGLLPPGFPAACVDRRPAPYAPLGPADRLGAREDSRQCVVVALRDGIELVVVAPRTGDGQAQERLADLVDLLIDHVDAQLGLVGLDDRQVAQHEEAGGDQVAGSLVGVYRRGASRRRAARG